MSTMHPTLPTAIMSRRYTVRHWTKPTFHTCTTTTTLLPLDSRHERLQKTLSLYVGCDPHIGLKLVEPLDDVTIAVRKMLQDIALVFVAAIRDRFTASKFAPSLDIDVHRRGRDESAVDGHADSKWIIHRRSSTPEFFALFDQKFGDLHHEVIHRAAGLGKFVEILPGEEGFVADLEAHHGQRPAGLKDNLRGFGVAIDVGFRGRVHIATRD